MERLCFTFLSLYQLLLLRKEVHQCKSSTAESQRTHTKQGAFSVRAIASFDSASCSGQGMVLESSFTMPWNHWNVPAQANLGVIRQLGFGGHVRFLALSISLVLVGEEIAIHSEIFVALFNHIVLCLMLEKVVRWLILLGFDYYEQQHLTTTSRSSKNRRFAFTSSYLLHFRPLARSLVPQDQS